MLWAFRRKDGEWSSSHPLMQFHLHGRSILSIAFLHCSYFLEYRRCEILHSDGHWHFLWIFSTSSSKLQSGLKICCSPAAKRRESYYIIHRCPVTIDTPPYLTVKNIIHNLPHPPKIKNGRGFWSRVATFTKKNERK